MKNRRLFALKILSMLLLPILAVTTVNSATLLPPTPCFDGVCAEEISEPIVEPIAPAPTPAPPSSGTDISWNPGWYYGAGVLKNKDKVTKKFPVREPHEILPFIMGKRWCNDPSTQFKGIRLKFHWSHLEPTKGNYRFDITDAWFNAVAQCAAGPKRILLVTDFTAVNGQAGDPNNPNAHQECVPEDLRKPISMVHWTRGREGSGKHACVGRIWDPVSPAYERYRNLYLAFVERYKDHPLFEGSSPKGEGALGIGDADKDAASIGGNSINQDTYNDRLRQLGQEARRIAPRKMVLFGTNFHGGDGVAAQARYRKYLALMDSEAGYGFRCPDSFAQRDSYQIPRTLHEQFLLSQAYAGKYAQGCETQNPNGSRFTSVIDEVFPKMMKAEFSHPNFDGSDTFPANPSNNNASHQATHPVAIVGVSGATQWDIPTGWKAAFDKYGWGMHYDACPKSWVGLSCRTGETADNPGTITR